MKTAKPLPSSASRAALVAEMQARLASPRRDVLLIVTAAGACAFLFAAASLWAGLESMAVRYFFATLIGYLVFVALIRAWIGVQRGRSRPHEWFDLDPGISLDGGSSSSPSRVVDLFKGGRSGGAGGGASWDGDSHVVGAVASRSPGRVTTSRGFVPDLDLDDGWWLAIAVVAAAGALVAVLYVVYAAPLLLAEVALDAAVVSTMYRRLRARDTGDWLGTVFRRTWLPASVVIASLTVAGYAVQQFMPEARSIGDLFR